MLNIAHLQITPCNETLSRLQIRNLNTFCIFLDVNALGPLCPLCCCNMQILPLWDE